MTPRRPLKSAFLFIPLATLAAPSAAFALDCANSETVRAAQQRVEEYTQKKNEATSDGEKATAERMIADYQRAKASALAACERSMYNEEKNRAKEQECADRQAAFAAKNPGARPMFAWKGGKCVDLSQVVRNISDSDECNNASVFTDLKGKNCRKALDTIKSVQSRNSALTAATTAGSTAYSNYQAMQASGRQDDAQLRQANIMKGAAFAKLATGAVQLAGAAQLQSAASGAEAANSTISEAQKNLSQVCRNAEDEQRCFYQNATKYGLSADSAAYANFERMKRGASQSHDQAEAASALAKQSMITGAADMLVGLQALKMAQLAQQNAGAMAPPPMVAPPPPGVYRFGQAGSAVAPNLEPSNPTAPIDYGVPKNAETFGALNKGPMHGSLIKGGQGTPRPFQAAKSGVSGGGGGASASSGGGGRGGRGGSSRGGGGGSRNSALGEIKNGGAVGFKGGAGGAGDTAGGNPFADALAKLFPQGDQGKPIVDPRQIAGIEPNQIADDVQGEPGVEASDLTIFEQVSAKYRQLNDGGRF